MNEEMRLHKINTRYRNTLNASVAFFREGRDHPGLDEFSHCVEDLEILLDIYQCTGKACFEIDKILPVYRKLLECMRNQDITGMTDLLEYQLYPLAMEQAGRSGEVWE